MLNNHLQKYINKIGLSIEDYNECKVLLRRDPLKTELAIFLQCGVSTAHINLLNIG